MEAPALKLIFLCPFEAIDVSHRCYMQHLLLNGCFYVLSEELLMFRIEIGEQMMSSENDIPVNIIQLVMQITPEQRQLLFYVQAFVHYK